MIHVLQFVASFSAALFAGAALYINVAEHPARMTLDTAAARAEWAPSYKRATMMQAPLAAVSFLSGGVVWLLGGGSLWLIGALLIGAVVPFTLVVIMPTNKVLLTSAKEPQPSDIRALLERWARLHAVRTVLSLIASALFLASLARGAS